MARSLVQKSLGNKQRDDLERWALSQVNERLSFFRDPSQLFQSILIHGAKQSSLDVLVNLNLKTSVIISTFYEKRTGQDIVFDSPSVPLRDQSFDLVIDCLTLHHYDEPGLVLEAYKNLLVKGGLFIGIFFGEKTMLELRQSLMESEIKVRKGASLRITPTISLKNTSEILQQVGFSSSVTDLDRIELQYESFYDLLKEIKLSGETSPLTIKNFPITKLIIKEAENFYEKNYSSISSKFPLTLDLITITGWRT